MYINQKIVVASKNALKIMTSFVLAFLICASNLLLCSSDDEREAWNAVTSGLLIDGGLEFDMMGQHSIDASFGFVSGEDSEKGVHSDVRELSYEPAEQFSRKRKRVEGDERRAKRVPAPDQSTAAHVLSLPDLPADLAPLQPFLLPYQDLDPALLLSLPLPCPDLSPVELQSDDQPLDGLFGTYEYGQDVTDVSGAHVAVGAVGDKAVASEGVDLVRGKRKRGNARGAIKIRDAEKPFECDFPGCTYASAQSGPLKIHKRTHTGEKPFKCNIDKCTYATAQKCNLDTHAKTHTDEKPFKCIVEGCTFTTAYQNNLIGHIRRHTDEKPFKCIVEGCTFTTAYQNSLIGHIRRHTGEKLFKCEHQRCDYETYDFFAFKKHKNQHHKNQDSEQDRPFKCPCEGCIYRTKQKKDIEDHFYRKHSLNIKKYNKT